MYPLNEARTLNSLAQMIHGWAVRKRFYDPCKSCDGLTIVMGDAWFYTLPLEKQTESRIEKAVEFCEKNPHASILCPICDGRGSVFDASKFPQKLLHVVGEVDEAFQLTRKHTVEQLIQYHGRSGVALTAPRYGVTGECSPVVPDKNLPEHPALAVELADIIIRVLDMSGWLGLDIGNAVKSKMEFNDSREERHGKLH